MKSSPETLNGGSQESGPPPPPPVGLTIMELSQGSSSQKLVKTSISVPGEVKPSQADNVTLVVNAEMLDGETDPPLCDEILSCISALDEVIAEFDDSISTSSSATSHSDAPPPQQPQTNGGRKSGSSEVSHSKSAKKSRHGKHPKQQQEEPVVKIMQTESQTVTEIRIGTSHLPTQQIQLEQRHFSPVKPVRQSKISAAASGNGSPYQIESSPSKGSGTSYGIIFPKASPSRIPVCPTARNGGKAVAVGQAPQPDQDAPKVSLSIGSAAAEVPGGSFPKVKTRSMEIPSSPLTSQSMKVPVFPPSKHKPIPVFTQIDEEQRKTPEVWDFHQERNLPRSLRKTRKTCFIENEEEDEEHFRNDLRRSKGSRVQPSASAHEISSQASPLLSKRIENGEGRGISGKEIKVTTKVAEVEPTQWLRYDDKCMELPFDDKVVSRNSPIRDSPGSQNQKTTATPTRLPKTPSPSNTSANRESKQDTTEIRAVPQQAKSPGTNSGNRKIEKKREGSKSQSFSGSAAPRPRQQQSDFNIAPPPPTTMMSPGPVLDVDDGYLSMINRHETPILWPEGFIESETFSADELKQLSSQLNDLNEELSLAKNGRTSSNEQKTDYFSDDSLEFEGELEAEPRKAKPVVPQYHSYFISTATIEPVQVPKAANIMASRKSWSPAGEIRIPPGTKSSINTNTWRKGPPASSFDENEENIFNAAKRSSPRRKPCAFFIPMHDMEAAPMRDSGVQTSPVETAITSFPVQPPPFVPALAEISKPEPAPKLESEIITAFAIKFVEKALRSAVPEAAAINTLLASTIEDVLQEGLDSVSLGSDMDFLVPVTQRTDASYNSSLGLSAEDKLSSSDRVPSSVEAETSSSSGIDYETSSEGLEQGFDSLEANAYSLLEVESKPAVGVSNIPLEMRPELQDFIEDCDQPPPFIPPPPKQPSPVALRQKDSERYDVIRESVISSGSERDSFPQNPPRTVLTERALRTHRQTSRSHENLLDIDRRTEYMPHPCVRRGHSATLPPNSVPPTSQRRPSAFRQLLGIFKRNKKPSNGSVSSSILDLPIHSSQRELDSSIYAQQDQHFPLPDHFYPKLVSRPSISESQGSHRSKDSRTSSNKRSVLSRIFRRKDK